MNFLNVKSSLRVGLEIHSHEVRLVLLRKSRQRFCLEHTAIEPLPAEIFSDGKIINWQGLAATLTQLVNLFDLKNLPTVMTLPVNRVRMQHIQLPIHLTESSIETEILAQLDRDLPGMNEPLSLDFSVVSQSKLAADILFAVTRQEYLSNYVNAINQSGLCVKIVDIDIYALIRMILFSLSLQIKTTDINAIFYIASETALLILCHKQEIIAHQYWEIDSHIVSELQERLQISTATLALEKLHQLIIAAPKQYVEMIRQQHFFADSLKDCTRFFTRLKLSQFVNPNILEEKYSQFLIPIGAAMRDIPSWL